MKKILYTLIVMLTLASCDDYVDIIPKGKTIPTTVDDFQKLLANGSFSTYGSQYAFTDVNFNVPFFEIYSDDYNAPQDPANSAYQTFKNMPMLSNMVSWADYIYGASEDDNIWNGLYKSIYVVNYVLDHIEDAQDGISAKRNEVKGQALVHRAMNYFLLTNLYAKQYNAQTSASDLSVPMMLHADVNAHLARATVQEVYDQILKDLNEAISIMQVKVPKFNNIPGLATAYALRARVYLWQQNYDKAYEDATQSLTMRNTLLDYNTLQPNLPGIPAYGIRGYDMSVETNPEILYSRYCTEYLHEGFSENMLSIIDKANDLRYKLFIGTLPESGLTEPSLWIRHHHSGIDISEVWLMKAETALRKSSSNINESLEALNTLRKNRYAAATYHDFKTSNSQELLQEILKERRREIIFTEMAFIDHKRQNADPSTARPMQRNVWGQTYTMPVDDPHWQLAIPLNVLGLNPLLIQNER